MEISVPINEINTRNIYFGEKRKNIIVDGDFVKIIYSTDSFEMNGLYILTEFGTTFCLRDSKGISPSTTDKKKCTSLATLSIDGGFRGLSAHSAQSFDELSSKDNTCAIKNNCISPSMSRTSHLYLENYAKQQDNIYIEDQNVVKSAGDVRGEWIKIVNKNSIITPKRNIILNILTTENARVIEQLCQIETEIVDRYIANNCPSKTASYVLKNQLLNGSIKYHSEHFVVESPLHSKTHSICDAQEKEECILKISGIWETTTNVGITMKFILLQNSF